MKKENPYSLMFGKEPGQMIARVAQHEDVIDSFLTEMPSQMVYMITGIRGSGKTVFMTDIENRIRQEKNWIVVQLNPEKDLVQGLLSKLCHEKTVMDVIKSMSLNLSFFGLELRLNSKQPPVTDAEVAVARILEGMKKRGQRLLIAIDEVSNNENVRIFAAAFQILIQQDLPVYLIMTGLYENIYDLQNEKTLTFLYRAPKIHLKSLNIGSMAGSYKRTMGLSDATARVMAQMTKGYAFAFQVLGYYSYQYDGDYEACIDRVRLYLEEYVYDKIWDEMSEKDKKILYVMSKTGLDKVIDIREKLSMKPNEFGPYRDRLIRKGVVDGTERGKLVFSLPFFKEYVEDRYQ